MFALEEEYFFEWLRATYNDDSLMSLPDYLRAYYASDRTQESPEALSDGEREYHSGSVAPSQNYPSSVHQMLYQADLYPRLERTLQCSEHPLDTFEFGNDCSSEMSADSLEGDALADVVRVTTFE